MTEKLPGIVVAVGIAALSFALSRISPVIDSLAISILFGMLVSNSMVKGELLQSGAEKVVQYLLPAGIALYGAQLSFAGIHNYRIWISVIAILCLTFCVTFFFGRILRLPRNLNLLLASGLSICGASAIAIVSSVINAKKEETSISIISILMIGLGTVIFYHPLAHFSGLMEKEFAFLTGVTVPTIGQVKVIGRKFDTTGIAALALQFKLFRVSMLLFLVLGLSFLVRKERRHFIFPWFMVVFLVLAALFNTLESLESLRHFTDPLSSFLLSAGLAAIGLSVSFDAVTVEGPRPLFAVFLSCLTVASIVIIGIRFIHV